MFKGTLKTLMFFTLTLSIIFVNCGILSKKNDDDEKNAQLLALLALTQTSNVLFGEITTDTTISGTVFLEGTVYVKNNATLRVLPGTVVKGNTGSSLFILPGSKLIAEGTATEPIVFTSYKDPGSRRTGDWGGIVLIGNSLIENRTDTPLTEGTTPQPYGTGNVPEDSSGSLKYVRIEFAGYAVAPGNELNGLSLYAVGSGTTISHVQIHMGLDDAIEFFGGRVNADHLLITGTSDDDIDIDEGYFGTITNVLAYRYPVASGIDTTQTDPRIFEIDGAKNNQSGNAATATAKGSSSVNIKYFTMVGNPENLLSSGTRYIQYGKVRDCANTNFDTGSIVNIDGTDANSRKLSGGYSDCNNSPGNVATINTVKTEASSSCSVESCPNAFSATLTGLSDRVTTAWNIDNPTAAPVFNDSEVEAFCDATCSSKSNWTIGWTNWQHN